MSKKESKKQATANPKQPQAVPVATIPQTHTLSLAERRSLGKQARQQTPRDVKRLAASFVIAGRANGFKASDCRGAARLAAETYRERMAEISEMPTLTAWYEAIDLDKVLDTSPDRENARFYRKKLAAAMDQSAREKEFAKLAHEGGYPARIIDQPPLIHHYGDMRDAEFRAGLVIRNR